MSENSTLKLKHIIKTLQLQQIRQNARNQTFIKHQFHNPFSDILFVLLIGILKIMIIINLVKLESRQFNPFYL